MRQRWPDQINVRGLATITEAISVPIRNSIFILRGGRAPPGHGDINVRHQALRMVPRAAMRLTINLLTSCSRIHSRDGSSGCARIAHRPAATVNLRQKFP